MNERPEPRFGDDGLVTTVVQDATTSEVLMVAHMNREAWEATLRTRRATFFSRSRQRLWEKGETSGNTMHVRAVRIDCDGDAVLLRSMLMVPHVTRASERASSPRCDVVSSDVPVNTKVD